MLRSIVWAAAFLAALVVTKAQAKDIAYLISNSAYDTYENVPAKGRGNDITRVLDAVGFDVTRAEDMTADRLSVLGASILRDAREADTLLIFVMGHVVSGPADAWLLGRDAKGVNAVSAGQSGLSLTALAAIGARLPGRAILLVADNDQTPELGYGMRDGLGGLHLPQGVTLVNGDFATLKTLVRKGLLEPDQSMASLLAASNGNLKVHGYVSNRPLFPAERSQSPDLNRAGLIESGYWQAVEEIGTRKAYEAYLDRYPDGARAGQARQRLGALQPADPIKDAQAVEAALGLDRDARRLVQRDLDILGFNPRGIDGIFGPSTRAALRKWQEANNFIVTGYLDRAQRAVLRQAAKARAFELQKEAEDRRRQAEAADRDYWLRVSASQDAAGYRQYLQRYPDGLFADKARGRLDAIENALRGQAQRAEREAWDRARTANSIAGYERYLSRYPRGNFAETARQRIKALKDEIAQRERFRAAAAAEKSIISGGAMALIVETRLAQLGYQPGNVDGVFDEKTRRAIRQYQRAVKIDPTGYIGQRTLVLLLSGRN
ncbi:MAG: peptidoglycan-binding protein [Rhodobacteraceae bacterium]|nr:peptidoglycan-binding protein [Paracoccaceae bacterium]